MDSTSNIDSVDHMDILDQSSAMLQSNSRDTQQILIPSLFQLLFFNYRARAGMKKLIEPKNQNVLHVIRVRLYILVRWTLSFETVVVTGTRSLACRKDSVASRDTFNITTAGYLTFDKIGLTVCLALCYTIHIWAIFIEGSPAYAKNLCPSKKFHFEKSLFRLHKKIER